MMVLLLEPSEARLRLHHEPWPTPGLSLCGPFGVGAFEPGDAFAQRGEASGFVAFDILRPEAAASLAVGIGLSNA